MKKRAGFSKINLTKIFFIILLMNFIGCSSLFSAKSEKNLSKNFTYAEAVKDSDSVNSEIYKNLLYSAKRMEDVRELLDSPIVVTSWYRPFFNNFFGGGAWNSAHKKGLAVDFRVPKYKDQKTVFNKIIKSDLPFDIIIYYKDMNMIHLGFKPECDFKKEQRMIFYR